MLFLLLLFLLPLTPPFHCPAHTTVKFDDLQQRSPSPLFPPTIPIYTGGGGGGGGRSKDWSGVSRRRNWGNGKIVVSGCGGVLSEGGNNTRNETCEVKKGKFQNADLAPPRHFGDYGRGDPWIVQNRVPVEAAPSPSPAAARGRQGTGRQRHRRLQVLYNHDLFPNETVKK